MSAKTIGQILRNLNKRVLATEWKFKGGCWNYVEKVNVMQLTLNIDNAPRVVYEVDLDRCRDSHQVLDWIFQIRCKRWATAACMKALLDGLYARLDPQANLCSFGMAPKDPPKPADEVVQ